MFMTKLTFDASDSNETSDDWVLVYLHELVPVHGQLEPIDGRNQMKVKYDRNECEQTGFHD